jgi:hypothetical protein
MVITNDGTGPALKVTQTGANSIAEFYDDGNALAFKVANDGLVGIGTATPLQKLHVNGSAMISSNLIVSGGDIKSGATVVSTLFGDTTTGSIAIGGALSTGTVTLGATGSTGAVSMFPSTVSQAITLGGATTGLITIGSTLASTVQLPSGKTKVGLTTLAQGGAVSVTLPAAAGTLLTVENALTSGSATAGFLKYNGTTAVAGQLDGGTTTPSGTTRLNYGGNLYPTALNVIGTADTTTAATHYFVETGSDGFVRPKTLANATAELVTNASVNSAAATIVGTITSGVWNAGAVTSSGNVSAGAQVLAPSGGLVGAPGFSWTGNANTGMYRPVVNEVGIVTNSIERVRVDASGNVGIGTTVPQAKLHVEGSILATGVHRVVSVDLSTQNNTVFYPIVLDQAPTMLTHYFSIEMPSQGGEVAYNMHSLHAVARSQGWSDQTSKYEVYHNFYTDGERSILGIYGGIQNYFGTVIYLRGGKVYSILTNSKEVSIYTSAFTTAGAFNSTFALKNNLGVDVSGTSVNISQLWSGMGVAGKYQTDSLMVNGNVGIGTTNPLAKLHVNGDVTITSTGALTIPRGTTAQRPTNPTAGMIRYNSDEGYIEAYDAYFSTWDPIGTKGVLATGGTVTDIFVSGIQYRVHTFTSVGTASFQVLRGGMVEYLVVAGGGAGGGRHAGGGGAGGVVAGTFIVVVNSYAVVVGAGAPRIINLDSIGATGNNSAVLGLTARGGGGGGTWEYGNAGQSGGSGGGNSGSAGGNGASATQPSTNPSATIDVGFRGGGASGPSAGGGGGGAGGVGANGTGDNTTGNGGNGVQNAILGINYYWGGGGGGAGWVSTTSGGNGGLGGGGGGGTAFTVYTGGTGGGSALNSGSNGTNTNGQNGGDAGTNTGGGGGGACQPTGYAGGYGPQNSGAGGSGIVIIRYRVG